MVHERVPCVLFDVGGVLIVWDDGIAFRHIARRFRIAPSEVSRTLLPLREDLQSGRITLHEFWSGFARRFDRAVPADWRTLWVSELAAGARPRRAVLKLAADLRRRGVRTGLFSNTDPSHWRYFKAAGWSNGFSPAIASFQLGVTKPHAVAFRRAMRRLPRGSGAPIFIDDRRENVVAARRADWDAIQFTSVPKLQCALNARGLFGPVVPRETSRTSDR
jgi:HAD superfamily hydrolase (TIGR01509 family)